MADETKTPETVPILLVFVGCRLNRSDELCHYPVEVNEEQFKEGILPTGAESTAADCYRLYEGKNAKRYMGGGPGNVYEVPQAKGKTSIYPTDAKYRGQWPDNDKRMEWQLEHRTATTMLDLRKKAKKEGADDNFSALKPVRRKMARLISQNQRAALLAQVIAYITAGDVDDDE